VSGLAISLQKSVVVMPAPKARVIPHQCEKGRDTKGYGLPFYQSGEEKYRYHCTLVIQTDHAWHTYST
jgi:hypothetical protein